jgi:hypothetical protein
MRQCHGLLHDELLWARLREIHRRNCRSGGLCPSGEETRERLTLPAGRGLLEHVVLGENRWWG